MQHFFLKNTKSILLFNLILSVVLSFGVYSYLHHLEFEKSQKRHEKIIQDFHLAFEQYLHPLEGILSTLHYSNLQISSENFRKAAESRNLFKNFRAASGFGFIRRVKVADISFYLQQQKKMNSQFELKRMNGSSQVPTDYFIIEVAEPIERNSMAIGLVVSDDPERLRTTTAAMLKGQPQITKSIRLTESGLTEEGFIYYLPVYYTAQLPAEERREKELFGWAYTPLDASEIIGFVLSQNPDSLSFQVAEKENPTKILYESPFYQKFLKNNSADFQKEVVILGQNWLVSSVYTGQIYWDMRFKAFLIFLVLCSGSLLFYFYSRWVEKKIDFDEQLILKSRQEVEKAVQELKESQEMLFAKAKLSLLGEMACGIAHEINNPLSVIVGKANILKEHVSSSSLLLAEKSRMLSDVEKIVQTGMRIAAIVKGLRSFSRDGENDPFQKSDLKSIIQETVALVQERIRSRDIELTIQGAENQQMVFCNRTQLEQVIINLLANSIDAISEYEKKWINIEVDGFHRYWRIRVSDSGQGIDSAVVEKMMNPFFTTKELGKGTGLGLSISKNILEKHEATLAYESYHGHTSFVVTIPKAETVI